MFCRWILPRGGDIALQVLFALAVPRRGSELAAEVGVVLVLTYPLWPHHTATPVLIAGFHFAKNSWLLSREVGGLLRILLEVEQDLASRSFVDQFPVAPA